VSYNLGTAAGRIIIDGSGAEKGFGVATVAANAFYDAISEKLDSVERLGDNLTKLGLAGSAGLGLAVRSAANFEQGLSAVKAVSGATTEEMDLLRKAALRIGKDTSFSASEAVSAIGELSKAGVSTSDILNGAADATVSLAAAGEIDLPRAAEIASSAINNFALSGKELPHVADLIAGAANASAIDVGDFGFSLSQAGAVANLTGLKFDDLAVAIAEMGQAGIKGSDAGTSIKTFLTNLIPTTSKQTDLFKQLGLVTVRAGEGFAKAAKLGIKPASKSFEDVTSALQQYIEKTGGAEVGTAKNAAAATALGASLNITGNAFFDSTGKMKSFVEIQKILKDATKDLSKEQKLNALNTLFGSDAIRASAVFADQGAEGFNKMATAIGKVKAADVAKTRLDNLNGSIEQLKGSFETMMITIGEVFLPIVKKIVDAATTMVNIFNELPGPIQKTIAVMIGLGSAFSLMTGLAIKLAFALGPVLFRFLGFTALKQVFSILTVGFSALRNGAGIFASLATMGGRAGVVFTRFAKIGKFLFSVLVKFPRMLALIRAAGALAFGPWGIALAAVVAGVILAYKKIKPFHDLVDKIASTVKGALSDAFSFAQLAISAFVGAFQEGDITSDGFIGKMELLGTIVRQVAGFLQDLGAAFVDHVLPALKEAGGAILSSLQDAWVQISATFQSQVLPALRQLGDAFAKMLPQLKELWVQLQPVLKFFGILAAVLAGAVLVSLYAFVKVLLVFLLPALIKVVTAGIQVVINILQVMIQVWIATLSTITAVTTAIVNVVTAMVKALAVVIGAIVETIKGIFNIVAGLVTGDWARVWKGATQIVEAAKDTIIGLLKLLGESALAIVKGFIDGIIKFFKGLFDTLVGHSIVPDMVNAIIRVLATLPSRAAGALASLGSTVVGRVRSAMNSMLDSVNNGISRVLRAIRSLPGRMRSALGNLGGILQSAGRQIIQGLLNGINSMIGSVRSKLSELTNLIPSWKGPLPKDRKLLTENGIAIIQSLLKAFEAQMPEIERFLAGLTQLIGDGVTVPPTWTVGNGVEAPVNAGKGSIKKKSKGDKLRDAIKHSKTKSQTLKDAMKHTGPGGDKGLIVNNNWVVNNPIAEKTSVTTVREATRRSSIGVLA
jgi:TP901 family phage tail tape measure protein